MRQGSAPNFCPPVEEGMVFTFEDENGDCCDLEFLGMVILNDLRYGFFFPVTEDAPATSSGSVIIMQAVEFDEEGQPESFELVDDEAVAEDAYQAFREAAKDLYDFE